jgi:hypothetical protein
VETQQHWLQAQVEMEQAHIPLGVLQLQLVKIQVELIIMQVAVQAAVENQDKAQQSVQQDLAVVDLVYILLLAEVLEMELQILAVAQAAVQFSIQPLLVQVVQVL